MSFYGRIVVSAEPKNEKEAEKISAFLSKWFTDIDKSASVVIVDETNDYAWSFVDELIEKIKKFQKSENIQTEFLISVFNLEEPNEEYVIAPRG